MERNLSSKWSDYSDAVNPTDLLTQRVLAGTSLRALFDLLDEDQNGSLDVAEIVRGFRKQVRSQPPPPPPPPRPWPL